MNFNSQVPKFIPHVNTFCAKVLPLVFDNSLSYYEFLCKMCHKVNECIDALNSQNLQIIEFTKMVSLELEKFEEYVDNRISEFENELKKAWEDYKTELNKQWEDYKTELNKQWEDEKTKNEKFRNELLSEFDTLKKSIEKAQADFENKIMGEFEEFKNNVNAEIEQFETTTNTNFAQFKNTMQTQQNEFENHMVDLFNNFKTTEKQARTDFESNFQQLFEQWKVDTLNALNTNISGWENESYTNLLSYINEQIGGFEASIRSEITNLSHALSQESDARKNADSILQEQINNITGGNVIVAGDINSYGETQLLNGADNTNIVPILGTKSLPLFIIYQAQTKIDTTIWQTYYTNSDGTMIHGRGHTRLFQNKKEIQTNTIINDTIKIECSALTNREIIANVSDYIGRFDIIINEEPSILNTSLFKICPIYSSLKLVKENDNYFISVPIIIHTGDGTVETFGAGRIRFSATFIRTYPFSR